MKPFSFLCMLFTIFITVQVTAQVDKINKTLNDIDNGRRTFERFKGLMPKKKVKVDTAKAQIVQQVTMKELPPAGATKSLVSIVKIDFPRLRNFTENIKACSGVQAAVMKYGSDSSTIEVLHTGTTGALLKLMEETSKDIFTEKNIVGFEEGNIRLRLK